MERKFELPPTKALERHRPWPPEEKSFKNDLIRLINCYSKEGDSDTSDFILADYLLGCLDNFNRAVRSRTELQTLIHNEKWESLQRR